MVGGVAWFSLGLGLGLGWSSMVWGRDENDCMNEMRLGKAFVDEISEERLYVTIYQNSPCT